MEREIQVKIINRTPKSFIISDNTTIEDLTKQIAFSLQVDPNNWGIYIKGSERIWVPDTTRLNDLKFDLLLSNPINWTELMKV
jgi:hypothetical protein